MKRLWHVIVVLDPSVHDGSFGSRKSAMSQARHIMRTTDIWGVNVTVETPKFFQWVGGFRRSTRGDVYWLANKNYDGVAS